MLVGQRNPSQPSLASEQSNNFIIQFVEQSIHPCIKIVKLNGFVMLKRV